ncbi:MAG: S24 family peptidase [Phycisphaerae bacterium]
MPIIGHLAAGDALSVGTEYAEQTPPGWPDAFVEFKDPPPEAFAVRVKGYSMLPRFEDRDIVIVDPTRSPAEGLACVI